MSRFQKYTSGDLPPLRKLAVGESLTGRLTGEHEYNGADDTVCPVLEIVDADTGREVAWRANAWRARAQLELADPQHGDVIRVTRLEDEGRSHQYEVEIVESAASVVERADDAPASAEIPHVSTNNADGDGDGDAGDGDGDGEEKNAEGDDDVPF